MSLSFIHSFILTCPKTKQKLWIGQGHHDVFSHDPVMESLYSGDPEVMENLRQFLNETRGKSLVLCVEDHGAHTTDSGWKEFTP